MLLSGQAHTTWASAVEPVQSTHSARFHSCIHPFVYSFIHPTDTPQCLLGVHWASYLGHREDTDLDPALGVPSLTTEAEVES